MVVDIGEKGDSLEVFQNFSIKKHASKRFEASKRAGLN